PIGHGFQRKSVVYFLPRPSVCGLRKRNETLDTRRSATRSPSLCGQHEHLRVPTGRNEPGAVDSGRNAPPATYAGTSLQSANPGVLIFETDIAPIGTFTLPTPSPSAGSSSAFQPPPTRAPPRPDASSRPPLPCPPFCTPRQAH